MVVTFAEKNMYPDWIPNHLLTSRIRYAQKTRLAGQQEKKNRVWNKYTTQDQVSRLSQTRCTYRSMYAQKQHLKSKHTLGYVCDHVSGEL